MDFQLRIFYYIFPQCTDCTVYSVQCTVYSVQCTQCTVYSVQCTVYSVHSVQCTQPHAFGTFQESGCPSAWDVHGAWYRLTAKTCSQYGFFVPWRGFPSVHWRHRRFQGVKPMRCHPPPCRYIHCTYRRLYWSTQSFQKSLPVIISELEKCSVDLEIFGLVLLFLILHLVQHFQFCKTCYFSLFYK